MRHICQFGACFKDRDQLPPQDRDCAYPRNRGRQGQVNRARRCQQIQFDFTSPQGSSTPRQQWPTTIGQPPLHISRRTHAFSTQARRTVSKLTSSICRKMQAYTSANDTATHISIGNPRLTEDGQPETCCTALLLQSRQKVFAHHARVSTPPCCSWTACMALRCHSVSFVHGAMHACLRGISAALSLLEATAEGPPSTFICRPSQAPCIRAREGHSRHSRHGRARIERLGAVCSRHRRCRERGRVCGRALSARPAPGRAACILAQCWAPGSAAGGCPTQPPQPAHQATG